MSELLPCPFCGSSKARISTEHDSDGFGVFLSVKCGDCRAQSGSKFVSETCPQTYAEVRDEWNARAAPPQVQGDDARCAARYRWLRQQRWDSSRLCVVTDPKRSVRLGQYCPTGDLLDEEIDAAMK